MASICVRMIMAILFGGLIGLEREYKRRPAGFRTYMLVCLGASLTMMISQYEYLMLETQWKEIAIETGARTDVARFGANVINGIGFLGAGTIILTKHKEIKGTTTAAGLWASACMGLAIGAGFYECVVLGFVLIFLCFKVFPVIENDMVDKSRNMNIYMELYSAANINFVLDKLKNMGVKIYEVDLENHFEMEKHCFAVVMALRLPKKMRHAKLLSEISGVRGVLKLDEI